jgi:hypothetical protein
MKPVKIIQKFDINGNEVYIISEDGRWFIAPYADTDYIEINEEILVHALSLIKSIKAPVTTNKKKT